jgi:hypothetical protein
MIARELCSVYIYTKNRNTKKEILKDKNFLRFNHINIWNFKNFINILKKNSFNIITTNQKKINDEFKYHIPSDEISFLSSWSNYFYIKVNF